MWRAEGLVLQKEFLKFMDLKPRSSWKRGMLLTTVFYFITWISIPKSGSKLRSQPTIAIIFSYCVMWLIKINVNTDSKWFHKIRIKPTRINSSGRCRTKPALILNSDRRHVFQIIIGNWKIDLKFQLCVKNKSMKEVLKAALMYYGSTGILILMVLWLHHSAISTSVLLCLRWDLRETWHSTFW